MYKIAVFSDIHGNIEALEAIINDIKKDLFDEVIFLGDIIGLGPNPKECLNLLNNTDIKLILGNHDLYYLKGYQKFDIELEKIEHYKWVYSLLDDKDREILKNKDIIYTIEKNGYKLSFSHYFIKDINNIYPYYSIKDLKSSKINDILNNIDADYFFYGHDHNASNYKFNDKYLIDVGSSGCVVTDKTFYTIIEINSNVKITKKFVKFDRKSLEKKLMNANYPLIDHIRENMFGIK